MKRLIFCFDGTWCRLDAPHPTNVVMTAETVVPIAQYSTAQLIFYNDGVGTAKGERLGGLLFGSGLVKIMGDAYRFLIFNYTPGDELYIFGFSRGAYTARSFVGMLNCCGVLLRRDAAKVNEAIERYRRRTDSDAYVEDMMRFRQNFSPQICVSHAEDIWRSRNVADYAVDRVPRLVVNYLGVWETVGALGIPTRYRFSEPINGRYKFHNTRLSRFVKSARHAVAIDERRIDFAPTLWDNIEELNRQAGFTMDAEDAPYQQKWFPGVHEAVGGGGDRRGLSDQALDWILDGARHVGLELDSSNYSRIYELSPNHRDVLDSADIKTLGSRLMGFLPHADRRPGPKEIYEVSVSGRRRWLEPAHNLPEGKQYRPATLARVASALNSIDLASLGIGAGTDLPSGTFQLYQVKQGDTIRSLAQNFYGTADHWKRIFDANLHKLDNPDRIYVGQLLRIPLNRPASNTTKPTP
jgi:uncharacterized protein (DUF2235 family)